MFGFNAQNGFDGLYGRESQVRKDVALVFFGKHGSDTKSSTISGTDQPSLRLLGLSFRAWNEHLVGANPDVRFSVFAHSWSPGVATEFQRLWGARLLNAHHEPTQYAAKDPKRLAIRCLVTHPMCERTASQVLSVWKALALKQEHEFRTARPFPLVIVTRHDLSLNRPWPLHPDLWATAPRDIHFLSSCKHVCGISALGRAAPPEPGCGFAGQICREHQPPRSFLRPPDQLQADWMFAGSSKATDIMGEAVLSYHTYSTAMFNRGGCHQQNGTHDYYNGACFAEKELAGEGGAFATHSIWPMHAVKQGLQLRFGKLVDGFMLDLTRYHMTETTSPTLQCYRNITAKMAAAAPPLRGSTYSLYEAPMMREQCPYHVVQRCTVPRAIGCAAYPGYL